jgi:hypothetical protein
MKEKNKTSGIKKKMPFSLKLVFVWMIFMIIRGIAKLTNLTRLEENYVLLGKVMGIINYGIDAIVLVAFVILISMFIIRKRNTWKYFVSLMVFLMIGLLIGLIYIPNMLTMIPVESQNFVLIGTIVGQILLFLFYALLISIVYRKRRYFYS